MVEITIHLQNSSEDVYKAGEMLQGNVAIILDSEKKFKEFYILIIGTAFCRFRTSVRGVGTTHQQFSQFEGSENLVKKRISILGNGDLSSGSHSFNFQFELPRTLPASLEAQHGNIRYKIEAVFDVPWRLNNKSEKKFTIVQVMDLNQFPELITPAEIEEVEKFCCFCCVSDHFIMNVRLPYLGFVPGQKINFRVEYGNKSNVAIKETRVFFKSSTKYVSDRPMSTEFTDTENLLKASFDGARENEDSVVECSIELPEILTLTNNRCSKVVQLTYELEVKAVSSGFHRDIVLIVPITIGSVAVDNRNDSGKDNTKEASGHFRKVQPYEPK